MESGGGLQRSMNTEDPRSHDDELLDETLMETFPASDPPANTVETGIVARDLPSPLPGTVSDDAGRSRFEINVEGKTASLVYRRGSGSLTLIHTEVPEELRSRGLGTALVEAAIDSARRDGMRIIAECPFARAYLLRRAATRSDAE